MPGCSLLALRNNSIFLAQAAFRLLNNFVEIRVRQCMDERVAGAMRPRAHLQLWMPSRSTDTWSDSMVRGLTNWYDAETVPIENR